MIDLISGVDYSHPPVIQCDCMCCRIMTDIITNVRADPTVILDDGTIFMAAVNYFLN